MSGGQAWSPGIEGTEDVYFGYDSMESYPGERRDNLQGYSGLMPRQRGRSNMSTTTTVYREPAPMQQDPDMMMMDMNPGMTDMGPGMMGMDPGMMGMDPGMMGMGGGAPPLPPRDMVFARANPGMPAVLPGRSPAYMRDSRDPLMVGYPLVPSYGQDDGRAPSSDAASKVKLQSTVAMKKAHSKIRSKYENSVSIEETLSHPGSEFRTDARYADVPKNLSAHAVEQEIDNNTQLVHINESDFMKKQKDLFGRDEGEVKEFRARAINHFKRCTGIDFSPAGNPLVQKAKSSLVIKESAAKDAPVSLKLSPYMIGNNVSWSVDEANGFPSIKKQDKMIELGYVMNIIKPSGLKIKGKIGKKDGVLMKPGQSLYFCEFMVRPARGRRKPVWIRARSNKLSEVVSPSERKAELQVACASLFQDTSEGIIRDYKGSAERTTNIDSVTVTSKAGTDAASKAKKEVFTKKKKASASLVVRFNAEPTLL